MQACIEAHTAGPSKTQSCNQAAVLLLAHSVNQRKAECVTTAMLVSGRYSGVEEEVEDVEEARAVPGVSPGGCRSWRLSLSAVPGGSQWRS